MLQISFILVEPRTPENVGAAARALKTMGFDDLRLVNPCDHLSEKARWLAHGSIDILEKAQVFPDLAAAIHDIDFCIGTTAKKRPVKQDHYTTNDLPKLLEAKGRSISHAAVVFGREDKGLNNEEIRLCDIISSIPMKRLYPSVNLAQAVMIHAFALAALALNHARRLPRPASAPMYRVIKEKSGRILQSHGIPANSLLYNRIMERIAAMEIDDIRILHSIINKFLKQNETQTSREEELV